VSEKEERTGQEGKWGSLMIVNMICTVLPVIILKLCVPFTNILVYRQRMLRQHIDSVQWIRQICACVVRRMQWRQITCHWLLTCMHVRTRIMRNVDQIGAGYDSLVLSLLDNSWPLKWTVYTQPLYEVTLVIGKYEHMALSKWSPVGAVSSMRLSRLWL
jgi:hypothetical protein